MHRTVSPQCLQYELVCRDVTVSLLTTVRYHWCKWWSDQQKGQWTDYWHIQESDFSELPQVQSWKHRGMKFTFILNLIIGFKHAYSAISENQHRGESVGEDLFVFMQWKARIIYQRDAKLSYVWKFQSISWTFTTQSCKTACGCFIQ